MEDKGGSMDGFVEKTKRKLDSVRSNTKLDEGW